MTSRSRRRGKPRPAGAHRPVRLRTGSPPTGVAGAPEIRLAAKTDQPAIVALITQQLRDAGRGAPGAALERAVRDMLTRPSRGQVLLATEAGKVVGLAAISFLWRLGRGHPSVWLNEVYVDRSCRGLGLGRALLRAACRLASETGASALNLEVESGQLRAPWLYSGAGFRQLRRERWVRVLNAPPLAIRTKLQRSPQ
jgi:GNAT superfamily N-acetyltransferase